jgi:hypothetical protein
LSTIRDNKIIKIVTLKVCNSLFVKWLNKVKSHWEAFKFLKMLKDFKITFNKWEWELKVGKCNAFGVFVGGISPMNDQ